MQFIVQKDSMWQANYCAKLRDADSVKNLLTQSNSPSGGVLGPQQLLSVYQMELM